MASEDRTKTDHLSYLRAISEDVRRYGFFAVLRRVEALAITRGAASGPPRIGRSRKPSGNVVDLGHNSIMRFPGAALDSVRPSHGGRLRLISNFLGLTGSMGPLPLHMTEFAQYEQTYVKPGQPRPFGGFLNLLTERALQFFYRAWADSQPAAQADIIEDDAYAGYLAALSGALDRRQAANDALPVRARLDYVSMLVSRRGAGVISDGMSRMLGVKVTIREYVVRWRQVETGDQTRLREGDYNTCLGQETFLGKSVCDAEGTFRMTVPCGDMAKYRSFLPGNPGHVRAVDGLRNLAPSHLDWDIELEINQTKTTGAALDGEAQLGWTSWLAPPNAPGRRRDLRLHNAT